MSSRATRARGQPRSAPSSSCWPKICNREAPRFERVWGLFLLCAGHGAQRHDWRCQTVSESDP